jgi:adenine-specific DNA-methyltransferase
MKEIDSIKHKSDTRSHIPSIEEAGIESASSKVKDKSAAEYPINPIVHRGQDPELFWLNKYGHDDREDLLKIDIRSLYRHEHMSPELLIKNFYRLKEADDVQGDLFSVNELFGNALEIEEIEKVSEYYKHQDGWSNRLIQGDSLLVMTSLLEREGMAGKIQMIYIDPPYGIKYGSNWQMHLHGRDVKDGSDEHLTGEPEQIKAYRDTWELGIHSYLSYLRDRLLVARELLTESGSCFVQISDENVHLVRSIMDEVFGSENFINLITVRKTGSVSSPDAKLNTLGSFGDYVIWYSKNIENTKYRQLYLPKTDNERIYDQYNLINENNKIKRLSSDEIGLLSEEKRKSIFQSTSLESNGYAESFHFPIEYNSKTFIPASTRHWSTTETGIKRLIAKNRVIATENKLRYIRYLEDFPVNPVSNIWTDLMGTSNLLFVVQTNEKILQRCLLMSTDPGDLVLDPTCGSGTTAYVAEQWGRRWITIDTSRIALNIAKTRLMTTTFPYYKLYDERGKDIRQGFIYNKVSHITLKSLANDETNEDETLYDQPEVDNKSLRVAGPFTVETLQAFEPESPEAIDESTNVDDLQNFEDRIFEHMKSAGIKNGLKNETAIFIRIERLASGWLHAEGFYNTPKGERKAYLHIGPRFGTVSRQAVNEAVKECRTRGDADWLIILGFSFESNISNENITTSMGSFEVTKTRMHDDLLQEGLLKKDKKAASFVTIGEPDIKLHKEGSGKDRSFKVEIQGLDIYDPIKDEVKPRSVADIAYWMVDDDYDGSNFIVRQVFFCGGDKDEFDKWRRGLDDMAKRGTKKKAEQTLKIEIDEEAFDRVYGHVSHPFEAKKGQKIAVKVISQFGEESMKVIEL